MDTAFAKKTACPLLAFLIGLFGILSSIDAQTNNGPATPNAPQNIIANPSFEDINTCSEFNQPCSPSAWFFVNRTVTSGYFPRYPSATGHRHLQIVVADRRSGDRQYWETRLLCPLQAGEKYTVSFKINSLNGRPNLRDIGCWFTDRLIFSRLDTLLLPRTYLKFTDAVSKDLKNGWFEITKEFTPAKSASFLIIGNFSTVPNADLMDQRQRPSGTIEIGIDDMSILPAKAGTCPEYSAVRDNLYSILKRHSEIDLSEFKPPSVAGNNPNPPVQQRPAAVDSLSPVPDSATRDLPEPRTDTLVIHNIQFEFDRYLVDNPDTLLKYRKVLTRPGIKRIEVVGFTDDKGSESYNQDLSEKRAREVAHLLTTQFNITPSLIESAGKGISHDYPTRELNRRVEIYIFH